MSCKVKLLALEDLKSKGIIGENRTVTDIIEFDKVNKEITQLAYEKYGVGNGQMKLFDTRSVRVNYANGDANVVRFDANNALFNILQDAVDNHPSILPKNIFNSDRLDEIVDDNLPEQLVLFPTQKEVTNFSKSEGNITEFIFFNGESKKSFSAQEILNNILSNYDGLTKDGKKFLELAQILITKSNATIKIVPSEDMMDERAFMQYRPTSNVIELSLDNLQHVTVERSIRGMLHELVHSVTVKALKSPTTFEEKLFSDFITEMFNKYKSLSSKLNMEGFKNEAEFVSEIMTNPLFQDEIKKLDNRSVWNKFIDFVRTLFGVNKNYNKIVDAILDIAPSTQSIDIEDINESNVLFTMKEEKDLYVDLKTSEAKANYTITRLQESIKLNLGNYRKFVKSMKDSPQKTGVETYIATLSQLEKDLAELANEQQIEGVLLFIKSMDTSLDYIHRSLNKIDLEDENAIKRGVEIYKRYLESYTVINDVTKLISALENDKKQTLINKKKLEDVRLVINKSRGTFEYLNGRIFDIMKTGMKFRLNDIKYFPQIEKKHKERLYAEHKNSKIPTDKESWVTDKMLHRDKQLIQEDLEDYITEFLENPSTDIANFNVLWNSSVNISSSFVQILNQMLVELDNKRIETERLKDQEFKKLFEELRSEKGTSDITKLYENILDFDKDGKPYLKGEYKADFYKEVHLKIKELRAKQKEEGDIKRVEVDALGKQFGLQSVQYQSALKELSAIIKKGIKEIHDIELKHMDFDASGKFIKIKDTWLSNTKSLSKTEQKVLTFFDDIVTKSHKQTYGHESLIKFSYGTRFLELPKVTKSDTERILTGNVKGVFKDKLDEINKVRPDDIGYTVRNTGMNNEQLYQLKIHYRDVDGSFDNKQQSLDLMTIMRLEFKNGNMYSIRKKAESDLKFLVSIAEQKEYYEKKGTTKIINRRNKKINTISGMESNTAKLMTNMLESRFYDIMHHSDMKVNGTDLNKVVGLINKFSAFFTLTFNVASGTANVLNANAQLFFEAFLKGQNIKAGSIAKANKIYGLNMADSLKDIYNPINQSYINQINEMFNVRGTFDLSNSSFLQDNLVKAGIDQKTLQVFQETGEHWIQSVISMAVLDGIKVMNKDGKFINKDGNVVATESEAASLLDMTVMDPTTGIIQTSDKVIYTTNSRMTKYHEGGKDKVDVLIRKKLYDSIGNYTETDQPEIMRHWYGKLVMLYRKYLIPMGMARLKGVAYSFKKKEDLTEDEKNFSYALQENEEGTYTTLIRYVVTALKEKKLSLLMTNWAELSDYEKHNIKRTVVEMVTAKVMLPLIVMMLQAAADDDDDLLYFLGYEARRLQTEISQYWSPSETYKILRSPIPSARLLETAGTLFLGVFDPSSYTETYERGRFKGENKYKIKLQKQIPIIKEMHRDYEALLNYQDNLFGAGL